MNPDPARAAPLSPVAPPSAGAPLSPDVTPPPLPPLGPAGPAQAARLRPIRTYVPRFRTTARTRGRLDALLPRYGVRALPLVPAEAFGRVAPLVVEIGSGYGEAALGYAAAHPEHDVLAAEGTNHDHSIRTHGAGPPPMPRRSTTFGCTRMTA